MSKSITIRTEEYDCENKRHRLIEVETYFLDGTSDKHKLGNPSWFDEVKNTLGWKLYEYACQK